MPEARFRVRWPDGAEQSWYSPSLVVHEHLAAGARYEVGDLLARTGAAMAEASERVRARYGVPCARAAATAEGLRERAADYPADAVVLVVAVEPPPPPPVAGAAP